MAEDRCRMLLRRVFALLNVDGTRGVVDGFHAAELSLGGLNGFTLANLRVLRRELIAVDRTCRRTALALHELQAGQAIALFEQFLICKPPQTEVLPPGSFLLAAMPLDHVSKHPLRRIGIALVQPLHQRGRPSPSRVNFVGRITGLERWPRDRVATFD